MQISDRTYKRSSDGTYEQTQPSLRRELASTFGFQTSKIVLLESSSYNWHIEQDSRLVFRVVDWIAFSVCGLGYSATFNVATDRFDSIIRNVAYDA